MDISDKDVPLSPGREIDACTRERLAIAMVKTMEESERILSIVQFRRSNYAYGACDI